MLVQQNSRMVFSNDYTHSIADLKKKKPISDEYEYDSMSH